MYNAGNINADILLCRYVHVHSQYAYGTHNSCICQRRVNITAHEEFHNNSIIRDSKFTPDHSLRSEGLNLNIGQFAREFALSDINILIKITINTTIHINSLHPLILNLWSYLPCMLQGPWINQYSGKTITIHQIGPACQQIHKLLGISALIQLLIHNIHRSIIHAQFH